MTKTCRNILVIIVCILAIELVGIGLYFGVRKSLSSSLNDNNDFNSETNSTDLFKFERFEQFMKEIKQKVWKNKEEVNFDAQIESALNGPSPTPIIPLTLSEGSTTKPPVREKRETYKKEIKFTTPTTPIVQNMDSEKLLGDMFKMPTSLNNGVVPIQSTVGDISTRQKRAVILRFVGKNVICPTGMDLYEFCGDVFLKESNYLQFNCETLGRFNQNKYRCCHHELKHVNLNCKMIADNYNKMISWIKAGRRDKYYVNDNEFAWENVERLSEFLSLIRKEIDFVIFPINLNHFVHDVNENEYKFFRKDGKVMCIRDRGLGRATLYKCPYEIEKIKLNVTDPSFLKDMNELGPNLKSMKLPSWNEYLHLIKGASEIKPEDDDY